ncbi:MAG: hypothetical protein IPN19_12565 [Elusimicrobia bacterium]|nr:hypothetical protein [Elusimicrobiota bacterium]
MSVREVSLELGQRLSHASVCPKTWDRTNWLGKGGAASNGCSSRTTGQVSLNSFLRLVLSLGKLAELSALFLSVPTTIAEMEKTVSHQRLRASRKHAS